MNARVLAHVERGQVKAEGADPARETTHPEQAGVLATVMLEALGDRAQIVEQLLGPRVALRGVVAGRLQPRVDELQQHAVGHVAVAGTDLGGARGEARAVVGDPLLQRGIDADSRGRLREPLPQLEDLVAVAAEDERSMTLERLSDGRRGDVGVAVHVAADPRPEAQHLRHADRGALLAEHGGERRLDLLEERRHHPVEDVGEEEENVLALVGDRRALARLLLGLPPGGQVGAHPRQHRGVLRWREHRVEALDQVARDPLLLLEHGAARGLGRMRGEDRLDRQTVEQRLELRPIERAAHAPQLEAGVEQARALRGAGLAQIVATAANAVDLLRQVHHLEVGRERAHQLLRVGSRKAREQRAHAGLGGAVAFARADRRLRAPSRRARRAPTPPCSRRRAPTSAPSTRTSSRSGSSLGGNSTRRSSGWPIPVGRHYHPAATT